MTTTKDAILAKLAAARAGNATLVASVTPAVATVTAPAPTVTTDDDSSPQHVATVAPAGDTKPPRVGRKWTERDYRARGIKPPSERTDDDRVRFSGRVSRATYDAILDCATERGVTLGEALDVLLA